LIYLLRILVKEAKAFRFDPHDGLHLCHAVLGAGYAHIAILDKKWKRRVEQIPQPHQLAQVDYRSQVRRVGSKI
jgi:hypothetical protein